MKKIYEAPITMPMGMEEQILAGSLKTDASGNPYQDLSNPETTNAISGNLSRRSVWEDGDDQNF